MGNAKQCSWLTLLPEVIFGAEDDKTGQSGSDSGSASGANDDDSGNDPEKGAGAAGSSSEGESGNTHDDQDDPNVKGLKSALEAERALTKKANKELAAFRKIQDDKTLAEKSEVEQLQIRVDKSTERETRLAAGFLKDRLDSAIKTAAKDFIDTDDALTGVDRSRLTFEQDTDDPSQVTIDIKSIEAAVKNLATAKPHFLKSGTDDGEPTGSQFGGSQRKQQTSADTYKDAYPSLR